MKKLRMKDLMKRAHAGEAIQNTKKRSGSGIFGKLNSAVYSFLRHDVDADMKARARQKQASLTKRVESIMQKKSMSEGEAKFVQRVLTEAAASEPDFDAKSILQSKKAPNKQETEMIKMAMMEAAQSTRQLHVDASGGNAHDDRKRLKAKAKAKRKSSKRALRKLRSKKWLPSRRTPSGPGPSHVQLDEED